MSSQSQSACHEAAKHYRERGLNAIAVCSPDHRLYSQKHVTQCHSPGKVPLGPWKCYQESFIPESDFNLVFEHYPSANVGVILGTISRLVGVDVDGEVGMDLLKSRVQASELAKTPWFRTGKGWRFLYQLAPGEEPPPNRVLMGCPAGRVEILSQGKMTVMPPSKHLSGSLYIWGSSPGLKLQAIPRWVYPQEEVKLRGKTTLNRARIDDLPLSRAIGQPLVLGERNTTLFRIACGMRRHGCESQEILRALQEVNKRCVPPLEEIELSQMSGRAAKYLPKTAQQERA
jgi:hypothetical protein